MMVTVKLHTDVPFFGMLEVDTFKKDKEEVERCVACKSIRWQGYDLPIKESFSWKSNDGFITCMTVTKPDGVEV